jgi:hypothetical protein
VAAAWIAVALACAPVAEGASMGARCSFAGGPRVLSVVVERDPADAPAQRTGMAYVAVRRGIIGVFAGTSLKRVWCRGATPTNRNVDTIRIVRGPRLTDTTVYVDQRRGVLSPGDIDEGDGSSEIELELDLGPRGLALFFLTRGDDAAYVRNRASGDLANLNAFEAAPDDDVFAHPGTSLFLSGAAGHDLLAASSDPGPYDPYLEPTSFGVGLFGAGGADGLFGSEESDALLGGGGADVIQARGGDDAVVSTERPRRSDQVDCGTGRDHIERDKRDRAVGCELRSRLKPDAAPDHVPVGLRLLRRVQRSLPGGYRAHRP